MPIDKDVVLPDEVSLNDDGHLVVQNPDGGIVVYTPEKVREDIDGHNKILLQIELLNRATRQQDINQLRDALRKKLKKENISGHNPSTCFKECCRPKKDGDASQEKETAAEKRKRLQAEKKAKQESQHMKPKL